MASENTSILIILLLKDFLLTQTQWCTLTQHSTCIWLHRDVPDSLACKLHKLPSIAVFFINISVLSLECVKITRPCYSNLWSVFSNTTSTLSFLLNRESCYFLYIISQFSSHITKKLQLTIVWPTSRQKGW